MPEDQSKQQEIERIADLLHADVSKVFHHSLAADSRPVIRKRLEELAALLSASHANEREEWIKRSEEWRINAEEKRNHLKTAEATLAAREGELATQKQLIAQYELDGFADEKIITDLKAELATAQKTIQALQEELEHCPTCESLRSQLTEAQAEKERIRGQLISHEHMAASGVYVETEKYAAMVAQLTEANAKLAKLNPLGLE